MKVGDEITLGDINKWKNKMYEETFTHTRFGKKDGMAWWNKAKRNILLNTRFKVIALPQKNK